MARADVEEVLVATPNGKFFYFYFMGPLQLFGSKHLNFKFKATTNKT